MSALLGAWCYRVSVGTGWTGVSILWLGDIDTLISFISVWQDLQFSEQIQPWDALACFWDIKQASNQPYKQTLYSSFLSPDLVLHLGPGIAQWVVCWARCPAWCSDAGLNLLGASGRRDFSLGVNMVLTPSPQNSFGWEYKPRLVCAHIHSIAHTQKILDRWRLATKIHPACTVHEDKIWLPLWLD